MNHTHHYLSGLLDRLEGQPTSHRKKKDYVIQKVIGTGGFSEVKKARSLRFDTDVAIKVAPKKRVHDMTNYMLILQEVCQLKHPNVVRCYEWFESTERFYIVFELAEGGDMFDKIIEMGRFPENEAQKVIRNMLEALDYIHTKHHMIHRDMKPENLLLRHRDEPWNFVLTDFGLSKVLPKDDPDREVCEANGNPVGTPGYLAPEVYYGQGYTKNTDCYGAGIVAYAVLCGWSPWSTQASDSTGLMREAASTNVKFYDRQWEGVSSPARRFVAWLCTRDKKKRPTAAEALQHEWLAQPITPKDETMEKPIANLVRQTTMLERACTVHPPEKEALRDVPVPAEDQSRAPSPAQSRAPSPDRE